MTPGCLGTQAWRTKWLTGAHGILAGCQSKEEDVLHLVVVLDGCVEELCIFGVILGKKHNVVSCKKTMFNMLKQGGSELAEVRPW